MDYRASRVGVTPRNAGGFTAVAGFLPRQQTGRGSGARFGPWREGRALTSRAVASGAACLSDCGMPERLKGTDQVVETVAYSSGVPVPASRMRRLVRRIAHFFSY